jgi:ATP-dependent Zn protease
MDLNQKQKIIINKIKQKTNQLSIFGNSPKYDWYLVCFIFLLLVIIFSTLYYIDRDNIKNSVYNKEINKEEKINFPIEKAKTLIEEIENKNKNIDQSL